MEKPEHPVIHRVLTELNQAHETRVALFEKLESELGRPVVSYFTSFHHPVMVDNEDVDMLQGILQKMDLSKGLAVLISSPGGDGLAAERIVRICRSFSGTGEYWTIVPGKAKSAASLVCFGSSKILMGPTSELGPVDPQMTTINDTGQVVRFSLFNIVKSYESLFTRAVGEQQGRLEPFLQQLAHYDEREIQEFRTALSLSEDIAVRALASGMLKGRTKKLIHKKIRMFLTPEKTMDHGRAIYEDEARRCGLKVESLDPKTTQWEATYELYIRSSQLVKTRVAKCIESKAVSFTSPPPKRPQ